MPAANTSSCCRSRHLSSRLAKRLLLCLGTLRQCWWLIQSQRATRSAARNSFSHAVLSAKPLPRLVPSQIPFTVFVEHHPSLSWITTTSSALSRRCPTHARRCLKAWVRVSRGFSSSLIRCNLAHEQSLYGTALHFSHSF